MADAEVSNTSVREDVRVRVPHPAPSVRPRHQTAAVARHPDAVVRVALERLAAGAGAAQVAADLHVPVRTVRTWWRRYGEGRGRRGGTAHAPCPRCHDAPLAAPAYAELLGWYLGDGHIGWSGRRTPQLAVFNDARYTDLSAGISALIREVAPGTSPSTRDRTGCTVIASSWTHWPYLFPQHGPGRKHERPIVLEPWQREVVEQHPGRFLRGMFHSDGCRVQNWATRTVDGVTIRYEGYPRYFFSNRSADVIGLCTWALDLLGVRWTRPRPDHVSVARRDAVAVLDEHVGPKT